MNLLENEILGNSQQTWLLAAAAFAAVVLMLRIALRLAVRRWAQLAQRTATHWDDIIVKVIASTTLFFLLVVGIFTSSSFLELPTRVDSGLTRLMVIALIVQAGVWSSVIVGALLDRYRQHASEKDPAALTTIGVLGFIGMTLLWSTVVLLALDNLGIDVTALVAGLGIGGVAVALAAQNILGDLFASLSIVFDKPFAVGDFLNIDDYLGSVEHVGLKTTRLRSLSGEQLIVSNSDLLGSRIRNYGRMFERRVVFTIGVTYQTPREKLKKIPVIIQQAVEAQKGTRFDRSHFMQYADYSLNFETVYYVLTRDYNAYMDAQQEIYYTIHERFEQEGIEFAYPTQKLLYTRSRE
jgi:small-conductance mechanosensitive channel